MHLRGHTLNEQLKKPALSWLGPDTYLQVGGALTERHSITETLVLGRDAKLAPG